MNTSDKDPAASPAVTLQPDIRRKRIWIHAAEAQGAVVSVEGLPQTLTLADSHEPQYLDLPEFEFWTPETPRLYTLAMQHDDTETKLRTGMREFTVKDDRFHLNNRLVLLKGIHFGASVTAAQLNWAKQAGFNLVYWDSAPSSTLLDATDRLGLMCFVRLQTVAQKIIHSLRNHASLVSWVVDKPEMMEAVRKLDAVRLLLCMSEVCAQMMRPLRQDQEPLRALQMLLAPPPDRDQESFLRHSGTESPLSFVRALEVPGPEVFEERLKDALHEGLQKRDLERVLGGEEGFMQAAREAQVETLRFQVDAVRANHCVAGYVLESEQLPKDAEIAKALREMQRPVRLIIQIPRSNLIVREEVSVTVLLANEKRLEGTADLSLQVVGPTKQVLWKKKRAVKLPKHGKELWSGTIGASGSSGTHEFVVRLMQEGQLIAQNTFEVFVMPGAPASEVETYVVDPEGAFKPRIHALCKPARITAPILIVPPLANSIRAYPEEELLRVLAQVEGGAVALIFNPPEDWNQLAVRLEGCPRATSKNVTHPEQPAYHYLKLHPVFDHLPARGLMRQPYRNVAPHEVFLESSDEDITGTIFDAGGARESAGSSAETHPASTAAAGLSGIPLKPATQDTQEWGTSVLVRRYGSGRIVFVHLRVLEMLGEDPLADRLFVNLLSHFERRSVPSETALPHDERVAIWLRQDRQQHLRKWMIIGEFPNNGAGHQQVYPPEKQADFGGVYPGWYRPVSWQTHYVDGLHSVARYDQELDLGRALAPALDPEYADSSGTAYAYTEFTIDRREEVIMLLRLQNATKVWFNGVAVLDSPELGAREDVVRVVTKGGRNTVLIKCSRESGAMGFCVGFQSLREQTISVKWWR